MSRKIILLILSIVSTISSSCGSTNGIIDNNTNYTSTTNDKSKRLEILERLSPREYEGLSDSSLVTIITNELIDTIPEWCFSRIPSLKAVLLKGKEIVVESNAFYACKNLQTINLNNVIKCGENAFKMTSIDSVRMELCENIEDFAFANCSKLREVSLSESIKKIGDFAFSSDTALVNIYVPNGEIGSCCFMGCNQLQSVRLGNVSIIGESAFLDCTSLKEITIPESVIEIKGEAFDGCTNLKVVRVLNRRTKIANNAFDDNTIIEYKK